MLARCPQCGVTHALASGTKVRQRRVHCSNCDAEFELFPALEIGGAGERVLGRGLLPVHNVEAHAIETAPSAAIPLDIEHLPVPLGWSSTQRRRPWAGIALAAALLGLLGLQLLIIPPLAPGQHAHLDQARTQLCATMACPAWHPPRAPEAIRTSAPDFFATEGVLHLQFVLESPIQQIWPILDIRLRDQLGTALGTLRLAPADYSTPGSLMPALEARSVRVTLDSPNDRIAGVEIRPR